MTMNPRILRITGAPGAWCHLCGTPVDKDPCIGIDVPNNAVGRDEWSRGHRTFVQMCQPCIEAIGKAILPPPAPKPDLAPMLVTRTVAPPAVTITPTESPSPVSVPIAPPSAPEPTTPAQITPPPAPAPVSIPIAPALSPHTKLSECLPPNICELIHAIAVAKGHARPRTLLAAAGRINYADLFLRTSPGKIAIVEKAFNSAGLQLAPSPMDYSALGRIKYLRKTMPLTSLQNLCPTLRNAIHAVAKESGISLDEKSTLHDVNRMSKESLLHQRKMHLDLVDYLDRVMSLFGLSLSP